VERCRNTRPVYDLAIDGAHEFIAGGIVVHNCDELAAWARPETWDQLLFGLRLGMNPQALVTTTPRPTKLIRDLIASPTTVETRGSSYDNRANLAPAFFERIIGRYEGTRLGRQEIEAEILEDNPGALWKRAWLEAGRLPQAPALVRVVVAVDPSGGDEEHGAEAGMVVAGVGEDGHGYVLEDLSLHASPNTWMHQAVAAYHRHKADRLVAEVNFGGKMVKALLDKVDPSVPFTELHASRGKAVRAEPVAALYEQGRVHHVGAFPALEDQLCEWVPGDASPDRLDALVWAITEVCQLAEWEFY
jgi:phage terminase large subunit-like protein